MDSKIILCIGKSSRIINEDVLIHFQSATITEKFYQNKTKSGQVYTLKNEFSKWWTE